jgi:flagellar assembly protein FliH
LSSNILRKAPIVDAPLIIDSTYELPYLDDAQLSNDLVEALQFEHPDAAPDEIEDALQEVMDQLRDQAADASLLIPELVDDSAELGLLDIDEADPAEAFGESFGLPASEFEPEAQPFAAGPGLTPPDPSEASELVENARREAQQVLAQADERAAEIERAAYDKGFEEGVEAGKAVGEEQAAEMIKQVLAIVDQATELHDIMLRDAESEMVALCLEIARKITQAELRTNPDVVKGVVSAAVKKINGSPRVTIKVSPNQVETLREHWNAAFGPDYREKEWIVEGDPNVGAGGCVLETKYGSIDARIGTQFAEIQKTFALLLGTNH